MTREGAVFAVAGLVLIFWPAIKRVAQRWFRA
jgi:hypothetical protein